MKITTDHPASSHARPVILDDGGELLIYASGIKAIRATLGLSVRDLAAKVGGSSRTIEHWEQGLGNPSAATLLLIATFLDKAAAEDAVFEGVIKS